MKPGKPVTPDLDAMEAAASAREKSRFRFRLFVAGPTAQSSRAVVNTRQFCEQHLEGRYDLEVVDVCQSPEVAWAEQIIAVPTLVKTDPLPLQRFVGDVSNPARMLASLHLTPALHSPT